MQPGTGSGYEPFEADQRTVCGRGLGEKALGKGTEALSSLLVCLMQPCSLPAALLAAFCSCLLLVLLLVRCLSRGQRSASGSPSLFIYLFGHSLLLYSVEVLDREGCLCHGQAEARMQEGFKSSLGLALSGSQLSFAGDH